MNRWKRLVCAAITACLIGTVPIQTQAAAVALEAPGAAGNQNGGNGAGAPAGPPSGSSAGTVSGAPSGAGQEWVGAEVVTGPGDTGTMGSGPSDTSHGSSGTVTGVGAPGSSTSAPGGTTEPGNGGNVPGGTTGPGSGGNAPGGTGPGSGGNAPGSTSEPGDGSGMGTTVIPQPSEIARPEILSEGAVVMDAASGQILFEKNGSTRFYPASITKLMTALLVLEHCNLDETVTFSAKATTNLEAGAVSLNLVEGDKLTVRQCLYALLLKSANEVANALAEHVAGSNEAFAKMMNDKARALGCTDTNFVNPSGLNDPNHYTTARDMALIARAAFQNETLCKIDTTLSYQLPATKKEKARTITMGHKMMYSTDSRYYPGVIGGKTGYTSLAGNTLVTGAERDGVRLIAVVLKSNGTHYTDTKALLDYGFEVMKGGVKGWVQDNTGWYYIKPDGNRAAGEWQEISQAWYWFDPNGYMATGWRQFSGGAWYYFKDSGAMAVNYWAKNQEKWFYLGADGVMLKNATTPDGYRVDERGVWIQ